MPILLDTLAAPVKDHAMTRGLAVMACTLLAACSSGGSGGSGSKVSAATMGARWPLTLPEGTLRCEHGTAVVLEAGGNTYALNGAAITVASRYGYADVHSIWADDAQLGYGLKKDLSVLITPGLELCS